MQPITINGLSGLRDASIELIDSFGEHRIIAFYGAMGAGKTTLINEICRVLGVAEQTSSPTFAIVNEYKTDKKESVYHFDFYRIDRIEEAFDFGYEEYFYSGNYCFIEWPEKIESLLPDDTLRLKITALDETTRVISIVE